MEKFLPIIVGTDMNAYNMMTSFHEAYGVQSVLVGKEEVQFTRNSGLKKAVYFDEDFEDPAVFKRTLKKVAEGVKSDAEYLILIGTNDKYQNLIIDHQDELRQDFLLNVPKPEVRDALFEKKDFYQTCEHYEMPIPKTYYYDCDSQLPFTGEVTYPVVVKPNNGVAYFALDFPGQEKVYKVESANELDEVIEMIKSAGYTDELITQDYIPGDDTYMFDAIFYANSQGEPQLITFAQVVTQEPQPSAVGNYTALLTRFNKDVMNQLVTFLTNLNYTGFANFDLKYDARDKTFKIFEVNLRQGRSSYYTTATGHNMAEFLVDDLIYHKHKDLYYLNEDFLFSLVPERVLDRYVTNESVLQDAKRHIADGKWGNPLSYQPDLNLKRRIFLKLRAINYLKKYREHHFN